MLFIQQSYGWIVLRNNVQFLDLRSSFSDSLFHSLRKRNSQQYAIPSNLVEKESENIGVNFISPLLKYGYRPAVDEYMNNINSTDPSNKKPILLYLPGFDGTFLSPCLQFPELHTIFDVRCMTIDIRSNSTYKQLKKSVIQYLERELTLTRLNQSFAATAIDEVSAENNKINSSNLVTNLIDMVRKVVPVIGKATIEESKSVYLAGESFGGILASDVALTILDRNRRNGVTNLNTRQSNDSNKTNNSMEIMGKAIDLKGLILINSATCYDRSRLAIEGPKVCDMPNWMYPLGLINLLPLFSDEYSIPQLLAILQGKALPSIIDNESREAYMGRVAISLPFVIPTMPREVLRWRLSAWLSTGCEYMASNRLYDLGMRHPYLPILIVAGEKDKCLPSIAEAERLASILPNTMVHIVEGAGHASTCGSRVDLAALCRKRFPELMTYPMRKLQQKGTIMNRNDKKMILPRTSMKDTASLQNGVFLGLEPRYDNKTIGLSPFKYWDEKYYRKLPQKLFSTDYEG